MKTIRKLKENSCGISLVESLVALGLMSMAFSLIGSGIFQALSIESFWLEDVVATREARHAGSWFAGDALNAEEVCDTVGGGEVAPGSSVNTVTLVWYDNVVDPVNLPAICSLATGANHTLNTAVFTLSNGDLLRTTDVDNSGSPEQIVLSQRVNTASFTRSVSGDSITMNLTVQAERGGTDALNLETFLRRLR